ncbi:MAG TPA: branched-chain amino acid ABC transporter substrate-binding protein [Candidatus Dormibacteraeota bacterium]|jgi:branched-chain amino acid transport system substrate-binding protein|nr:branched-chain amino acid ABC transporter substrate-binding protein [Candidatus Dormibacteraeota bacterium]
MEHTRAQRLIPLFSALSLAALAACGTSNNSSSGGSSSGGGTDLSGCSGAVTVASDLPTSGGDAAIGGGTEKGVKLAVDQANSSKLLGGCTITYVAKDDASVAKGKHDPDQGARNMTELANNAAVVGVVGPFNSGVAVREMPISSAAGLVQISPSNTDPGLTIVASDPDIDTASLHKDPTGRIDYFRIISNDVVQAQIMANYSVKTLGLKKIYDISDNETYGKDLSNYYDKDIAALGATIIKRDDTSTFDREKFKSLLTGVQSQSPDGVFYGGVASNGSGVLKLAMQDVGLNAYFLSGDGTVDPQYFKDAGAAGSTKAFASSAPDATNLPSAGKFNTDYKAAYNSDPVAYSAYGYDCMNILLAAVKNVLLANGGKIPADPASFRSKVAAAVAATDYNGAIGHTKFDTLGDTLNHSFSIYAPGTGSDGKPAWVGKETVSG